MQEYEQPKTEAEREAEVYQEEQEIERQFAEFEARYPQEFQDSAIMCDIPYGAWHTARVQQYVAIMHAVQQVQQSCTAIKQGIEPIDSVHKGIDIVETLLDAIQRVLCIAHAGDYIAHLSAFECDVQYAAKLFVLPAGKALYPCEESGYD